MNRMFRFIKKIFFTAMTFFNCNALKCALMNNQECKKRPEIININSNEPSFYPYFILVNKCSGSCNNTNNPYAKLCVLNVKEVHYKCIIWNTTKNDAINMLNNSKLDNKGSL